MSNLPINVLIIEDDPADAQLAQIALRKAEDQGFSSAHVTTIPEALKVLENQRFDIVLLDLGLPGSFRLDTLARFRRGDDRLPVIVISGLDDEHIATEALGNDAQDYICKNEINPIIFRGLFDTRSSVKAASWRIASCSQRFKKTN